MPKIIHEVKAVLVEDVLKELQDALALVKGTTKLPISSVEIVLKIATTGTAGVDFSIPLISKLSGKFIGKVSHVSEMHIVFEPKDIQEVKRLAALPQEIESMASTITKAINSAITIVPSMKFKSAKAQVDFTVDETGSITFVFTGSEEIGATHSLIFSFGEKEKKA